MFKRSNRKLFGTNTKAPAKKETTKETKATATKNKTNSTETADTVDINTTMNYSNYNQEEDDETFARRLNQEEADAELARKIVKEEMINNQNEAFSTYTSPPGSRRRATSTEANCPGRHGLTQFLVSNAQRVSCNICHRRLNVEDNVFSCIICNYDVCQTCYRNPSNRSTSTPPTSQTRQPRQNAPSFPFPMPSNEPPSHMCIIPCELGKGICVEMLVDTGAQSSVISYSLAQRLNLTNRLDRSHQGVAAGVGTARIMGKLRNITCTLHQVEFAMDFIVLDVQDSQLLLLGLDQMRKYKCIVDLERNLLIFGGMGGVEVPLLPPEQSHMNVRNSLGQLGCPMM